MTIVKWLIALISIGYLVGLVVLFFTQRSYIFPIPQKLRTAPDAAGFPEAEEHILSTAAGESVIVCHVPAKPGQHVVLYFRGNGDYVAGHVALIRAITSAGTGHVAYSNRRSACALGR